MTYVEIIGKKKKDSFIHTMEINSILLNQRQIILAFYQDLRHLLIPMHLQTTTFNQIYNCKNRKEMKTRGRKILETWNLKSSKKKIKQIIIEKQIILKMNYNI